MGWVEASLILFGGLVAVMGLGLPVAFAFLALNIVGAWLFLGGEPGLAQLARNAVQSVIAIVAGTVFSAISGSTIATTALLGSLMLPTMLARGYEPKMAMGPIMGIGGVDMLIPPSALTVLLGSLAGISIAGLLIAGIVPGLILSALFVGWIITRVAIDPTLAPNEELPPPQGFWERWRPFLVHVLPLVAIFAIVVGA